MGAGTRLHFLGWDGPLLAKAAAWLLEHEGPDLSDLVVALPGARAGRRLRELLARGAPPEWRPPRVVTQGALVDELVELEHRKAGRLARTLAWEEALTALPPRALARLVAGRPGEDERSDWLRLAAIVRTLHGELAAEGLSFQRLVEDEQIAARPGERARYQALAQAQERFREALRACGLDDPHEARSAAIEAGRVRTDERVVLVGVADASALLRRVLDELGERVTALVFAPAEVRSAFDEHGCLVPGFWAERELDLPLERWRVVGGPDEQAAAAVAAVAERAGRFASDDVAFGVPDEELHAPLARRLDEAGVRARVPTGTALARTAPARLLAAVGAWVGRGRWRELAALARHPDLEARLDATRGARAPDLPAQLDAFQAEHLPEGADEELVARAPAVARALAALRELLGPLADGERRRLADWAAPVRAFLVRVYGERALDERVEEERVLARALAGLGAALDELEALPAALAARPLAAETALEILARELAGQFVPPAPARPGERTVELLGWLELPLDDAALLVVTGFQEGCVPDSRQGDPFLPDALRQSLGLPDERARLARDAYALELLLRSREELVVVTGRRSRDGDPHAPSRLAFHAPPEDLPARVQHWLEEGRRAPRAVGRAEAVASRGAPRRADLPRVEELSVTAFRTWLESPYLFYLRHVLGLDTLHDRERELDPLAFGNLTHEVLCAFGRGALAGSTDAEAIEAALRAELERRARQRFGARPLPAVRLQLERLGLRLGAFARWQATWRGEGWRIHEVEWAPAGGSVPLEVEGEPLKVRGRIDRIDVHESGERWAILDYKTGDAVGTPESAHRARDERWRDLQLPLYVHLARGGGGVPDGLAHALPDVGYVALPKDAAGVGAKLYKGWCDGLLAEALDEARRVVRAIRAGELFEVGRADPREPVLRALCGLDVLAEEDPAERDATAGEGGDA